MAVSHEDGPMPLYLHTVYRVLREMRVAQQEMGGTFNYAEFKRKILSTELTPAQLGPLKQRLDTLESFMPDSQTGIPNVSIAAAKGKKKGKMKVLQHGNDWSPKVCI
jgi:hypothetical protein